MAYFYRCTYDARGVKTNAKEEAYQHLQVPEKERKDRTSSPSLIALPSQLGRSTRPPALTCVGMIFPSIPGDPGPVAMTTASGREFLVTDDGRKMPDAVFWLE